MHDVKELKQFGLAHARAQGISARSYQRVCARIGTDEGAAPGSWVGEWSALAERRREGGDLLAACAHANLARFPFVDGPERARAQRDCASDFAGWADGRAGIERLTVDHAGTAVRCWAGGLSASRPQPLLIVMGGIVSVKEQWAPLLARVGQLGMAGVVAELPGVGENGAPYTAESWRFLSSIADAVADRADTTHVYLLALSFSGHLALRWAARDPRVRGIVTAGAPVSRFFTDTEWQSRLPGLTVDTLDHLTGAAPGGALERMASWGLTAEELAPLDIPVYYVASRRDEIVPPGDPELLRRHVRGLRLLEYDEDHSAPRYATETRVWIMRSLLRLRGGHPVRRAVVGTVSGALRGRRRVLEAVK